MKRTVKVVETHKSGRPKKITVSENGEIKKTYDVSKKGKVMGEDGQPIGEIKRAKTGRYWDNQFLVVFKDQTAA